MMENNKVKCVVNGEEVVVAVKETIPFMEQKKIAKTLSEAVVTTQGEYKVYNFEPLWAFFVLSNYTDFVFPEDWGDNEIMDFCNEQNSAWREICACIRYEELERIGLWAKSLIEYRKECYKMNSFDRMIERLENFLTQTFEGIKEHPEMLDKLREFTGA